MNIRDEHYFDHDEHFKDHDNCQFKVYPAKNDGLMHLIAPIDLIGSS